jgi:hypothetical protein
VIAEFLVLCNAFSRLMIAVLSRVIVRADALRLLNISVNLDLEIVGRKIVNHFAASVTDRQRNQEF